MSPNKLSVWQLLWNTVRLLYTFSNENIRERKNLGHEKEESKTTKSFRKGVMSHWFPFLHYLTVCFELISSS